jgi:hypothetical protein
MPEFEDALALCDEIQEILEELPEKAQKFRNSVESKVQDMRDWIAEHQHCTPKQYEALKNMKKGAEAWQQ